MQRQPPSSCEESRVAKTKRSLASRSHLLPEPLVVRRFLVRRSILEKVLAPDASPWLGGPGKRQQHGELQRAAQASEYDMGLVFGKMAKGEREGAAEKLDPGSIIGGWRGTLVPLESTAGLEVL